jgi:putative salt-induced outer membrane protein YdiY
MRLFRVLVFFLFIPLLIAGDDFLIMKNNDHLRGEIKGLNQGVLQLDTDYDDVDFMIKWKDIKYIESSTMLVMVLSNGDRFVGSLQSDPEDSTKIIIMEKYGKWTFRFRDLVYIKPFKENFKDRFNGSFDFGYSLTKANTAQQLNVSGNLSYLTKKWTSSLNFSSVNSLQEDVPSAQSSDANINFRRFLSKNWFGFVAATFRSSDEQQLDLRSTGQGGGGKYFLQTNRLYFMALLGGAWTVEMFSGDEDPKVQSLEGLLQVEFNAFDVGDLDFFTQISTYPSITQKGRTRVVFSSNLKWKLPYDFYFKVSYNHNYDSAPPNDASKNDYTFTTSFGWKL